MGDLLPVRDLTQPFSIMWSARHWSLVQPMGRLFLRRDRGARQNPPGVSQGSPESEGRDGLCGSQASVSFPSLDGDYPAISASYCPQGSWQSVISFWMVRLFHASSQALEGSVWIPSGKSRKWRLATLVLLSGTVSGGGRAKSGLRGPLQVTLNTPSTPRLPATQGRLAKVLAKLLP